MTESLPKREFLESALDYDPESGELTWRTRTPDMFADSPRFSAESHANIWNGRNAGKPAFQRIQKGYRAGSIDGSPALAHRVIWKLWTGDEPETIDHINGDKLDNRISNLRNVSQEENNKNSPIYRNNTSGWPGITKTKHGRWKVQIGNGEYLGVFLKLEDAIEARKRGEHVRNYHVNHGR